MMKGVQRYGEGNAKICHRERKGIMQGVQRYGEGSAKI